MTEQKLPPDVDMPPADHTEQGKEVRRSWVQKILDAWRKYVLRRGH